MLNKNSMLVQIGRDSGNMKSVIRWENVTALNDNDIQVFLTLLRNTYTAVINQATIRGVKQAPEYIEPAVVEEKKDGNQG